MTIMRPILITLLAAAPLPAPLKHALEAARGHNHTLGISRAQLAEQVAGVQTALAAFTPTFQATGAYTRSEYKTALSYPNIVANPMGPPTVTTETITITPYNGFNGTVGLNVPLVVPAGYARYSEAQHSRESARGAELASDGEVMLSTARAYYQVVAAQGVVEAAVRALATARDSLKVAETKKAAGTETQLTVDRARVDVNRAVQTLATGRQTLGVARRSLETLTGEPLNGDLPPPGDPELPTRLESDYVDAAQKQRGEVLQAREALAQQEAAATEAWAQFAPSLNGSAKEFLANAAGFTGHYAYWNVGVNLSWTVDPVGTPAAIRHAAATVEEQRHRLLQAQDTVRDDVHTAWLEIEADHARLTEAISEVGSAREAVELAQKQFIAGTATSLDVSSAQRDAFNSDATLAQARSDMATALLELRKAAGEPLLEE
jgi:outer membrane protein TolC